MTLILPPFALLAIGVVIVARWMTLSRADLFADRTLARENTIALVGAALAAGGAIWLAVM